MSTLFKGGGFQVFSGTGVGNVSNTSVLLKSFTLSSETTTANALAFPTTVGRQQVIDSDSTSEVFTAELVIEALDQQNLELLLDQKAASNASIAIPQPSVVTVPATPFAVTLTGITADQDLWAVVPQATGRLTQVAAAGSLTGDDYQVTADTVTFHSGLEGSSVLLTWNKTETTVDIIGGTNASNSFGTVSFVGQLQNGKGTWLVYIPQMARASGATLGATGDANEATVEFTLTLPSGWAVPYLIKKTA